MSIEILILALLALMLIATLIAAETRDLLSSVIAVGAAGFALSVIDLLLGAPDLAITQVVVEVLALVLLIRMIVTREDTSRASPRDAMRTGVVLLGAGVLLVVAYLAIAASGLGETVPAFGESLLARGEAASVQPVATDYLANAAEETGAANAVMAVLLDYRAYDTLGEATVIFVSILGVFAVLRHRGRVAHHAPSTVEG
jgi:multisubunit Na+/H+ antiporter MnhB subunit